MCPSCKLTYRLTYRLTLNQPVAYIWENHQWATVILAEWWGVPLGIPWQVSKEKLEAGRRKCGNWSITGSVMWGIWKFAPALVLTGCFPKILLSPRETSCLHIRSPLLTSWHLRGRDGVLNDGGSKVTADPCASKTFFLEKNSLLPPTWSSFLESCPSVCLENKSPCALCGARQKSMEEGWITDWYRGGGV